MRLATIKLNGSEAAAVVTENGVIPMETLNAKFNKSWSTELLKLLMTGQLEEMKIWFQNGGKKDITAIANEMIPLVQVNYGPLYRHPRKIWGIGLNYVEHAADLH